MSMHPISINSHNSKILWGRISHSYGSGKRRAHYDATSWSCEPSHISCFLMLLVRHLYLVSRNRDRRLCASLHDANPSIVSQRVIFDVCSAISKTHLLWKRSKSVSRPCIDTSYVASRLIAVHYTRTTGYNQSINGH